jgi:hypothetical protein
LIYHNSHSNFLCFKGKLFSPLKYFMSYCVVCVSAYSGVQHSVLLCVFTVLVPCCDVCWCLSTYSGVQHSVLLCVFTVLVPCCDVCWCLSTYSDVQHFVLLCVFTVLVPCCVLSITPVFGSPLSPVVSRKAHVLFRLLFLLYIAASYTT